MIVMLPSARRLRERCSSGGGGRTALRLERHLGDDLEIRHVEHCARGVRRLNHDFKALARDRNVVGHVHDAQPRRLCRDWRQPEGRLVDLQGTALDTSGQCHQYLRTDRSPGKRGNAHGPVPAERLQATVDTERRVCCREAK